MDLNAPLGMNPSPPPPRRWGLVVVLTLAALGLASVGVYLVTADPRASEPFAVASIPPPPPPPPVAVAPPSTDPTPTGSIAPPSDADPGRAPPAVKVENGVRMENGVRIVSPLVAGRGEPASPGPLVIDVSKALDGDTRKSAANRQAPGLQANLQPDVAPPNALLPGATPPLASASAVTGGGTRPRIALFVGGLGLSDVATRTAIEILPPAVAFAFVPYGDSIAGSVGAARAKGHEILLQLPMQGARGAAPGPHALRADETAAETAADMDWLTTRFEGYQGATNLLGADVTASPGAMNAVLAALGRRHVFYVDDGTSKRSVAPGVAARLGVGVVQADVVLDATGDPAIVRGNLEKLAAIAKAKGSAIGVASSLSDHLSTVARFANDLGGRGISLVPISALVRDGSSVAQAR